MHPVGEVSSHPTGVVPAADGTVGAVPAAPAGFRRRHHVHGLHLALSQAGTVAEVAAAVSSGLCEVLDASVVTVCTATLDGVLRTADVAGYPAERLAAFATIPMSAPLPLTDAARTRRAVWLPDHAATVAAYPPIEASLLPGTEALAALPLTVADRLIGALGVTFLHPVAFDADQRAYLDGLAGQVAVALERAVLADAHRVMAETLQRSLLPGPLPDFDGVAVVARYRPAEAGTSAGGDWYDVLRLEDGRLAVAVGDVVGHGAAAAAVMGQLRSALNALLLAGFGPARALQLLDRFAGRVTGAAVATAACAVLDQDTARLTYATAGHPPPLVLDAGGSSYLTAAAGPALGIGQLAGARAENRWQLDPTSTLLLYTDGLVETRTATLDDGLDRLAAVGAQHRAAPVADLVDGVLGALLDPAGATDDVAVVALRLLPAPLQVEVPATPAVLSRLRRAANGWAAAAGLPADTEGDLQLALGEAAGNAAEHAYRDAAGPGPLSVTLALDAAGTVQVTVADAGTWRPAPADPGHRGRGLAMIRSLASDVAVDVSPSGSTVTFRLLPPAQPTAPPQTGGPAPDQPARVTVTEQGQRTVLVLTGDLDQAGVAAVGDTLRTHADGRTPLLLDLTGLRWLTSVGIGLLLEVTERAGGRCTFALPTAGAARRALDLTGVDVVLDPGAPG